MNHAQWERLKDLFQAALDQPASARREWLQQQCPDDPSICLLYTSDAADE